MCDNVDVGIFIFVLLLFYSIFLSVVFSCFCQILLLLLPCEANNDVQGAAKKMTQHLKCDNSVTF